MIKLLLTLLLAYLAISSYALELVDFVPNFLLHSADKKTSESEVVVKPLIEVKRNSSQSKSWYCNRNQDSAGNVFCSHTALNRDSNFKVYESDIVNETNQITDSFSPTIDISKNTSANQFTLQDQEVRNSLQNSQNKLMLPISPSKGLNMNINQQQIQFNIKY